MHQLSVANRRSRPLLCTIHHLINFTLAWRTFQSCSRCLTKDIRVSGPTSRRSALPSRPSRPREFHPEPLTDSGREPLDSSGSCHRAKAAAFHRLSGSSRCRLTRSHGDDLPPSLHGHYPASSLLRGSPPLSGASVL